jgi:hypothetical protein
LWNPRAISALIPSWAAGSPERSDAGIPPGAKLDVRRQTGIDEALGLGDRPFIELRDPGCKRIYERIQIGVRQGAIDVAVGLGLVRSNVFRAQEYLERAVSADEPVLSAQPVLKTDQSEGNFASYA